MREVAGEIIVELRKKKKLKEIRGEKEEDMRVEEVRGNEGDKVEEMKDKKKRK